MIRNNCKSSAYLEIGRRARRRPRRATLKGSSWQWLLDRQISIKDLSTDSHQRNIVFWPCIYSVWDQSESSSLWWIRSVSAAEIACPNRISFVSSRVHFSSAAPPPHPLLLCSSFSHSQSTALGDIHSSGSRRTISRAGHSSSIGIRLMVSQTPFFFVFHVPSHDYTTTIICQSPEAHLFISKISSTCDWETYREWFSYPWALRTALISFKAEG